MQSNLIDNYPMEKRIPELNNVHGQLEIMEEDAIMWMLS
jgi:hypothetical protein